ncbi:MAG: regulatory protein RecX [Acidobacteria bacterium]|nr:regulatory protein RecX [Acidobacteriota bacterium]MBV9479997.1 regulatory protein RecX [Acidobacteriota bacterium]
MTSARPRKPGTEEELYEYAVGMLARRMRSVAELKRLLRRRVEGEGERAGILVELVIRRLKDQNYLDDTRFATAYASYRRDNQKFGQRRVITDLKVKGVHADVIAHAVSSSFGEIDEENQAREYLRRKRLEKPKNHKDVARIFRQLLRAGFAAKTIFTILKQWDVDDEVMTILEAEAE